MSEENEGDFLMLNLSKVTKTFGNTTAVASVSINIDRPMMVGIIGASGAGNRFSSSERPV